MRSTIAAIAIGVPLAGTAVAPAAAVGPTQQVDGCENADRGPERKGSPGFVAGLVPDSLSDLFAGLPVPTAGKESFGAPIRNAG